MQKILLYGGVILAVFIIYRMYKDFSEDNEPQIGNGLRKLDLVYDNSRATSTSVTKPSVCTRTVPPTCF